MPLQYPGNSITKAARAASGGGFESAIAGGGDPLSLTLLDGNLNNGSRVRISTDGTYNIGTKPGGAHELHDFGHTTFERGGENTFNAGVADDTAFANNEAGRIWTEVKTEQAGVLDPALKSDAGLQRHGNAQRFYRLYGGKASVRNPKAFEDLGRNEGYRTLYHAWWQRVKYNAAGWRSLAPTDLVGTFQADEPLSVNGGEFSGVYVSFDAGRTLPHRVIIENGQKNNTNLNGKVVTGVNSGATMTFSNGSLPGQAKLGRWWDDPAGNGSRCSVGINDFYTSQSGTIFDTVDLIPGQWMLFELELELTTGFLRQTVDGRVRGMASGFGPEGAPNFSPSIAQVGVDISIADDFPEQITDFAEHVFDRTLYRVYLGNAATWASVTHRELQRLVAWDGAVDVALNYGALAGGWLYLIGADGQPINTDGLEVV